MTYVWRGLVLTQLVLGLPVGLLVSVVTGVSLDEGDVVVVGARGTGQDPHEVTVVAEILQKARHPPEHTPTPRSAPPSASDKNLLQTQENRPYG